MIKTNNEWEDYKVLRTGNGYKLEKYANEFTLLRPDPQVIWETTPDFNFEKDCDAYYKRSARGGGFWNYNKNLPEEFFISWRNLTFSLKLMGFKHTGVFPEQAFNWAKIINEINNAKRQIKVLNLFAYTGGATLACASAGASVCHVDAAKSMCERAKTNAELSGLSSAPIRYIVEDCQKFVEREIKRKNKYDAIIMDPPSYGRGPKGEVWKITDKIYELVKLTKQIISEKPLFYLINSYTTGLQPTSMQVIVEKNFASFNKKIEAYEIGVQTEEKEVILPCGSSAYMVFE